MQQYYNRNLRFYDYTKGQRVWLKTKHYKSGENPKVAPCRNGPWTIVRKLPNGVNFEITNASNDPKTVHHDRLSPATEGDTFTRSVCPLPQYSREDDDSSGSDNEISASEDAFVNSDSDTSSTPSDQYEAEEDDHQRWYPRRIRQPQLRPGTLPWEAITS